MIATRLDVLRSQLAGLRMARAGVRQLTAWSAVASAIILSLLGVFLIDWFFQREMQVPQRVVLLAIAIAAVVWAYRKFAEPLLAVTETDVDMALMVERQQQIDTDLVAAIQFEGDVHGAWGSRQLETAVIEYVAQLGKDIDVYQGLNREQLNRRLTTAGILAAVVVIAAIIFPGHFGAFLNRIALGNAHYPSATRIVAVAVNGRNVLTNGMKPQSVKCAEGRPIEFLIRCEKTLPPDGSVRLASANSSQRSEVELTPLSLDERKARLVTAKQLVTDAKQSPGMDLAGPWLEELASLVRYESPETWKTVDLDADESSASELGSQVFERLPTIEQELDGLITKWPDQAGNVALFRGSLPRLTDAVSYRLALGDAYTDPAQITMIPLPSVEATLTPIPPKYAAKALSSETAGRTTSVLVGSEVKLAVTCTNKKPLKEAWLIIRTAGSMESKRFNLSGDNERTHWALDSLDTPLGKVTEELRYEIQVTDDDGLHLETPIKGSVRIRLDKPPVAIAATVHRVVLPTAKPSIAYRVGDDFGIKRLQLEVKVEREADQAAKVTSTVRDTTTASDATASETIQSGEEVPLETTVIDMLGGKTVSFEQLPLAGKQPLKLSELKLDKSKGSLQKGDRLKVVLLAEDNRGDQPGETFRSEPIIIDISDEFGVASAVGEADPQAEQRVTEIIKRQLGIGESP